MKKIILTGGAGFIGSNILKHLIKLKYHVVVIDDLTSGKYSNIEGLKKSKYFGFEKCSITNYKYLNNVFKNVDFVLHQAASKKTVCDKDPRKDLKVNAEGAFNLLKLSSDHNVKKFIHASTGSVFGENKTNKSQNENSIKKPVSYYGVSKNAAENYIEVFNKLFNLNYTVLRYFHVYGPNQDYSPNGGVISIFINNLIKGKPITIYGDGSQQRIFTYVEDVVRANMFSINNKKTNNQIYNCTYGKRIKLIDALNLISKTLKIYPNKLTYTNWKQGDIKNFNVSNQKLIRAGFNYKYNFDLGIKNTIKSFYK